MVSHLFYYQLALLALLWLFIMLPLRWPRRSEPPPPVPATPITPKRKRSTEPKAFEGLTHKPHCALCERETGETPPAPPQRPDPMPPTHRRPRTVDTSMHFCPHTDCAYRGWLGMNNLRANGHPNGGPWRQLHCTACEGYFPEHHGTIFYGKQAAVELIVHVLACLAEGLGIRATARVFEVDANTVLHWLVEAAEHLRAFSAYFLCDLHVKQLQLDEFYAVLSAVKDGEITEAKAIKRLSRSPQWVWVAMDPESKLLLTIEVGDRTLAMAQRVVHHVAQVLVPDCAPLFVTDGFREYMTALLTHYGSLAAAATAPGHRPQTEAALDAAAAAALRAGGEDHAAASPGPGESSRGVWHAGGRPSRAGAAWLAYQYRLSGAPQPHHPAAYRRGRATGQHAVQGRRRVAAAAGRLPLLLQFLFAPRERMPAPAAARAHQRDRIGHAVAAPHAGHGSGADRPCLDPPGGAPVPRAAVAPASGGVSQPWWWEAARGGDLSW